MVKGRTMSLDADLIVDRRRMRRKLTFWRALAIAVIVLAVLGMAAAVGNREGFAGSYIARITIKGLIQGDDERVRRLDKLAESENARAVIVHINSPGGTTAGSEQLYDALKRVKEKKPLVVVVDGLAASGGYITALAADHIVARQTSLVGSIGVLAQFPNVGDLLSKIGVKVETIKSSPLKASPNGFEPTSPEARAAIESIIKDTYGWFKGLVQSRRSMTDDELQAVADGRVFTGHQAIGLKLIDEIGDEHAGIAWLAKDNKIDPKLPVHDYPLEERYRDLPFLHAAAVSLLEAAGLGALTRHLDDSGAVQAVERLNLDGLLALWQPSSAN
jgi:protease IV